MKKIKILYARTQFWFDYIAGGSVGHTIGILNGFKENNCELLVVSNEEFLGIDDYSYNIIKPVRIKPNWLGELFYNFYAYRKFKKILTSYSPDYVYHRYTGYTFFVTKLASILNIPLILEFNSFDTWKLKHWESSKNIIKKFIQRKFLYKLVERIENFNLSNAKLIVTVSEQLKKSLSGIGIKEDKILVNYNGFDLNKFNPEFSKGIRCKNIKKSLGISDKEIVVGFTGTFGPWHGIPQLTESIDFILKNMLANNIRFLIIGDGGKLKMEMGKKLSKYNEVIFTGLISYLNVQYYLGVCDILLSPHCPTVDNKEFFGSPTKIFEYMAMGKAIVASSLGQIGTILKNNDTAILVKPGSSLDLAEGILRLVNDRKLRSRIGKNAYREAIKKYTWEENTKRILGKLRNIV
jgi:glycosyltransferase involved in cell wall biosynthesis